MKTHVLLGLICATILHVHGTPVVITAREGRAQPPQEVLDSGKQQEETAGVFKSEPEVAKGPPPQTGDLSVKTVIEGSTTEGVKEVVEASKETIAGGVRDSRQSAPAVSTDDDDDDDDDDDLDLGLDDDDDDDDDDAGGADDDDDDDDYLDGLFDGLLGDDDDDDDDDDAVAQPAVAAAAPAASRPVLAADAPELTPEEELDAAEEAAGEGEVGEEGTADANISNKDPVETEAEVAPAPPAPVAPVSRPVQVVRPVPATEDDDDDDDDDDDVDLGGLGDDDDDDDDDDDAGDDDDDDEADDNDVAIEVIEVKQARALNQQTRMPQIYITKYNRFVDTVIGRINKVLAKSFDPVRVKLNNEQKSSKGNVSKGKKKKKKGTKRRTATPLSKLSDPDERNKMGNMKISRNTESEAREPAFILISKNGSANEDTSTNSPAEVRATPKATKKKKKNSSKKGSGKANQKARATLYGLSSIRRDGDVSVNMMSDHTTVKTNFLLGPLTLRVEKEFGKGPQREMKSATATTTEMFGRLNLRIVHGGAATLHSIRVLQPKQVRVESLENHDKTREYVWKRSSHIAHVVSQKLATAARSMLKPPPVLSENQN